MWSDYKMNQYYIEKKDTNKWLVYKTNPDDEFDFGDIKIGKICYDTVDKKVIFAKAVLTEHLQIDSLEFILKQMQDMNYIKTGK
jgi:hypothetical protein